MNTKTSRPPLRGGQRHSKKKKRGRRTSHKRGRGVLHLFGCFPAWLLWLGGLFVVVAYVCFFYKIFVEPFSFRWRAIFGEPTYPEGYDVRGIDVSHYQDTIHWDVLCNASIGGAPVSFVFIKATEGENLYDDHFERNFFGTKQNGLIRGAYHFFVPGADPHRQAAFFLQSVQLEGGDLPPVLDVEKKGDLAPEQLRRDVKIWLDIVEKAYGAKPILYTNIDFKRSYLNTSAFDAYPYWMAHHYVDEPKYKGRWAFWQHTDCGKVSGIKGKVDCNIFNGTLKELEKLTLPKPQE